jgi:Glycosyltransferase family 87
LRVMAGVDAGAPEPERELFGRLGPRARLLRGVVGAGAVCAAFLALGAFGIAGVGRAGAEWSGDLAFLRCAGQLWAAGADAYDPLAAQSGCNPPLPPERYDFAYPPNAAPLALLSASMALPLAKTVFLLLNLVALAAFVVSVSRVAGIHSASWAWWVVTIVGVASPFTAHVVWMGQTTLIAAAALSLAWYQLRRGRQLAAGLLLGAALFKPQLCAPALLWIVLDGRWRVLLVAAATAAAGASWPAISRGVFPVLHEWLSGVAHYRASVFNQVDFQHVFGLQSTLAALGLSVPNLLALAAVGVVLLHRSRARLRPIEALAALVALALLAGFSHDYDLVAVLPLAAALLPLAAAGRWESAAGLAMLAAIWLPQRVLRPLGHPLLLHYREVVVAAALTWLVVAALRPAPDDAPQPTPRVS